MGHEGDTKAFVGHDHGKSVEGSDGRVPTTEKQWRDTPKGLRPKEKPSQQHTEPEPEKQKATGEHKPGGFSKEDKDDLPEENPEHRINKEDLKTGPVQSKSGANTSYDEVVVAKLGGGEETIQTDGKA